jgi:hypothetical protein
MNALTNLIAARADRTSKNWTQGRHAATGPQPDAGCSTTDPKATCFCALGALLRVADWDTGDLLNEDSLAFAQIPGYAQLQAAAAPNFIPDVNDEGVHADVMSLYEKAIELAGGT